MAKPNLTSIFTSTNQYSVLKLLKALCDAVDHIDYADNTEFTNFKEQVNTAVASLTSTDNSLEQSIMNNENAISDLNTVTGNNSTEINSIKNQISSINTDISSLQPKLYRHVLTLSNNNFMYSGYIVYISTSNLKVNSLEGLTALLKPSNNYIHPLTGTCAGLDTRDAIQFGSKNLYIKSFDKISYENNMWYFKDNYGDTETFDSVSDTVTPL